MILLLLTPERDQEIDREHGFRRPDSVEPLVSRPTITNRTFYSERIAPMPATMYYDQDADLGLLTGKTIAIIAYGSQGHAQAQNLRDSGCDVVVGQRPGSPNHDLAVKDGFKPVSAAEAATQGDLVNLLLPDEVTADIYTRDVKPNLKPGNLLLCSHGFNIHFGQVIPPAGVDTRLLVAPKGPGSTSSGPSTSRAAASPA